MHLNTTALTHSAIKVAVYKDKDKVRAISSGGKLTPPSYIKDVVANCFKTGTSKERLTPPIKKLKRGKININPIDIKNTGICFP